MQAYKDDVVSGNTKGIEFLFKKNKVTWLKGWATIPAPGQVKVGDEVHDGKKHRDCNGFRAILPPRRHRGRKDRRHLHRRPDPAAKSRNPWW